MWKKDINIMGKKEIEAVLNNKNIAQKIINSFNEYLRFTDGMIKEGLTFEKKVTKFSKTSAAVYLPKRLIGRTFRIILIPLDEPYELSETVKPINEDKLIKDTEKDLKKIQEENKPTPKIKNLLDISN
jgi:putative transposon-encoded protein